jgi:hypothetical protein
MVPTWHPTVRALHVIAADASLATYVATARSGDLDDAANSRVAALNATPSSHPDYGLQLAEVAAVTLARHIASGNLSDLSEAIRLARRAVEVSTAEGNRRARALVVVAAVLGARHEATGNLADIERAVAFRDEAIAMMPIGAPDRPQAYLGLAQALGDRFVIRGDVDDLDRAIDLARLACEMWREDVGAHVAEAAWTLVWLLRQRDRATQGHASRGEQRIVLGRALTATVALANDVGVIDPALRANTLDRFRHLAVWMREALEPDAPRPRAGGRRVERHDLAREARTVSTEWELDRHDRATTLRSG